MSLLSMITQSGTSSASSYGLTGLAATSAIESATSTAATATTAATDSATISAAAKAAAAATTDNAKDFATLATDTRATLDAQYKAAEAAGTTDPKPDMTGLSGRALAAVVLNQTGSFTKAEAHAAKAELNDRLRNSFVSATSTYGTGMSGLSSISQQMIGSYDSMSTEEREARGWTSSFRATNVATESIAKSSLFDQIDS